MDWARTRRSTPIRSDAVGGVVNIITRTDFEGAEASLYTADTQRGDGFTYDASFIAGYRSADRQGKIIFSAGIQRQDPVFTDERSFSTKAYTFGTVVIDGAIFTVPIALYPISRIDAFSIDRDGDGKGDGSDLCGAGVEFCTPNPSGGYRPFQDSDVYFDHHGTYLYTPSSRYSAYTAGSYKLGAVTGFFEASYWHRPSQQQSAPEAFSTATAGPISKDSLYNPLNGNVLGYTGRLDGIGLQRSLQDIDTFRIVGGVQGTIPEDAPVLKGWKWEVSYNHGRNYAAARSEGNLNLHRLADTIGPSFIDASGVPRCGTPTAVIAGCVPINVLGLPGSIDPAAYDYIMFAGTTSGRDVQQTGLATIHGRIAKLPNDGDLSVAAGADVRHDTSSFVPDPLITPDGTTVDVRPLARGSATAFEGFAEASLVPVSRKRYAEWLELDLAARAFRYESSGNGMTWSAGGLFRPIHALTVRGMYATAFRAPSISDVYQDKVASAPTRDAATARTITAGIVFEPSHVPGLGVTVDYWNIATTEAIPLIPLDVILTNCYTQHAKEFCDQIHRSNDCPIEFIDCPSNDRHLAASGVDTSMIYAHKVNGLGSFRERLEAQYLFNYDRDDAGSLVHGRGNYSLGVNPWLKASLSSTWQNPNGAGAGFVVRYVGSLNNSDCGQEFCEFSSKVDAWYKIDLFGSYTFKSLAGQTTLTAGVDNVLDHDPPVDSSDPATYDFLGRLFYLRLSQRL